jgi:hypothetical protein
MKSPFLGQNTGEHFTFDWKSVRDPYIGDGFINLQLLGEFYQIEKDICTFDAQKMHYYKDDEGVEESQVAISRAAANCYINHLAQSRVGELKITQDSLKQLFNNENMTLGFDTTTLAKHISLFEGKLGEDKPLMMKLVFKNIDMKFA